MRTTNTVDPSGSRMLAWLATTGAAPAEELAAAGGVTLRAAQARLRSIERAGLASSQRLLHGEPALYALTRRGLQAAGRPELEAVRISASGFAHALAVARVATALREAGERVGGERELRAFERLAGSALASAAVGLARDGTTAWHRPDLVCWRPGATIAVEVELTVKAPERLRAIVRGWARSRIVAGAVYYATPAASRAVAAAVASESSDELVAVLALERAGELPLFPQLLGAGSSQRSST
jgi:DNA-binding MarR family transcriptional regulator